MTRLSAYFISILILLFTVCCKRKSKNVFELQENTGIDFTNNVENSPEFNIFTYRNFYNGGGVAIGDVNNDGLADVFFSSNMGSNKLYLNKGGFEFQDISEKAGITGNDKWNTGVVMVDINADGWLDIYVCNAGYDKWKKGQGNSLYINNGDLTFTEKATEFGLNERGYSTHAAFFDYDLDGDLDCYVLNNSFIPVNTLNYSNKRDLRAKDWPVEDFLKGGGSLLLRNDNGKFTDVSEQAGIYGSLISFGLGVTVGDINGDHYPDIYISNDFFERDYLYINQKDGTFKEDLEQRVEHTSLASMGADLADINNDGYPDIFTTDMLPDDEYRLKTTTLFEGFDVYRYKMRQGFYHQFQQNALQVNDRNGRFIETAFYSGVAASDWSWGALIFDMDNDGLSDIFVCNGIYKDVIDQDFIDFFANDVIQKMVMTGEKRELQQVVDSMPSVPLLNKMFRNNGNLKFQDIGANVGLTQASHSNGAAYGDLDNDGDLDLVVSNVNMPAFVYRNNSNELYENDYIAVELIGTKPNGFAVGSTIKLYCGNEIVSRELIPARGFQSSIDHKLTIGLGKKKVDSMVIIWPDRSVTSVHAPEVNRLHKIDINKVSRKAFDSQDIIRSTLFNQVANGFAKHTEDDFVDFYNERNIPVMLSREGPKAAIADLNGDALPDIYIGGAKGQPGQLYLNHINQFTTSQGNVFDVDVTFEDSEVLFFDADGDNDQDLFVGAGGNNQPAGSKFLYHRLYRNDGKGNLTNDTLAFPRNNHNVAVAAPHDIDADGDIDLFVGCRNVSYDYGQSPVSYIYQNDGKGRFIDVTEQIAPSLRKAGMITDAMWKDVNGDGKAELIVVGEWMSPKIFYVENGGLAEKNSGLGDHFGWWQCVQSADVDKDGDNDLILGNFGENFYLNPTSEKPVKLWMNDFDKNGIVDKVLTRTIDNADVPVFLKKDFTDAMPAFKKNNLRHSEFARKSIPTLFSQSDIANSRVLLFNYSSSCIAINDGKGVFKIVKLPAYAQLSAINAIVCDDINSDGAVDLVVAGNNTTCLPQFGRLDAITGTVLLNDGKGNYSYLEPALSGLFVRGMTRDIELITINGKKHLLFLRNDDVPLLYKYSN